LEYAGQTSDGSRHYESCTAETRYESERGAAELVQEWRKLNGVIAHPTLAEAAVGFMSARSRLLSPATIREYQRMLKALPASIGEKRVKEITAEDLQRVVNSLAETQAPKTVKNEYAFYLSVIRSIYSDSAFRVILPTKRRIEYADAEDADVIRLIESARGTPLELAIAIASFTGMRRSEIAALKRDDIDPDNGVVRVRRAMVLSDKDGWVVKSPKTFESARDIDISPAQAKYILSRDSGKEYLVGVLPDTISKQFIYHKQKLGITIRFHDLRSYNISTMHALGIPDKYIIKRSGHATPNIMNRVYNRVTQRRVKTVSEVVQQHFDGLLSKAMQHEMQHARQKP
jgi:integrase